ncbi:MAG: TonB-dependent receptor, partial [Owenweeksia sp.]
EIYNDAGNLTGYYDDQVDNYSQNHYQLHYNQVLSATTSLNISGHYTKGSGYYEEYQNSDSLGTYGITGTTEVYGDVVRRLWLDNDFYGVVYNLDYKKDKLNLIIGGGANYYDGIHFGELVWARYAGNTQPGDRFYISYGDKLDANVYAKAYYDFTSRFQAFADVQYRRVSLSGNGDDENDRVIDFSDDFNFVNPKAGLSYRASEKMSFYASYAVAHREPNRQDYIENDEKPKAETLNDLEVGGRFSVGNMKLNVNYFLMQYQDQLVLTGKLNNVGYPIRSNVGQSYRTGVELEAQANFLNNTLLWMPNLTVSTHKNVDYVGDDLTEYGNTPIAYSPNLIGGSVLKYTGIKNFEIAVQNKYVGEQFLDNTGNDRYRLEAYFLTDLRLSYNLSILNLNRCQLQLSIFNLTDERYISNGYVYGTPYYYAQAGINYMAGLRVEL